MGEYRKILSSDPAVENVVGFIGGGRWQSSNTGSFFVTLKPIGERDPVEKVLTRLRERIAKVPGARSISQPGQDCAWAAATATRSTNSPCAATT